MVSIYATRIPYLVAIFRRLQDNVCALDSPM